MYSFGRPSKILSLSQHRAYNMTKQLFFLPWIMNIWNLTKFLWQFFIRRVFSDSGFFVLSSLTVNIPFFKIQLQVFKMKKFGTSNSIFKIQSAEIQIVQKVGQRLSTGKRRWSPKKSNKAFTVTGKGYVRFTWLVWSWPQHINSWERDYMLWQRDVKLREQHTFLVATSLM